MPPTKDEKDAQPAETQPADTPPTEAEQARTGGGQSVEGYTPPDNSAELEAGYAGVKVDPMPNEAYSLEDGPDSPSALDGTIAAASARVDELEASRGEQTV